MKIVFVDLRKEIERRKLRTLLTTNCLDTRNLELLSNLGVGCVYHFLDAFTTDFMSLVILYMDVEFSTLPVEQGKKSDIAS